ncbi:unnamed protein product [Phytophthora fragariaefolia]|uniref:Unnamed protein product n=1 Tax=Phytophthora fragariaefolia TaxID=1490495 RepID=A0A9W6YG39_9STRA|nr:unnamed protein product [Phytophthora fragariaefolia]
MKRALAAGRNLGAVKTDDAGQCARAKRILALMWPEIIFLRCFAHDVKNLVRAVLKTVFKEVLKQAAAATAALNSATGKWLVRANEHVYATHGETLAFIMLYLAHDYRHDPEFPEVLTVLGLPSFWRNLVDAERVIRPLSEASFRLQKNENTMADVARCFGKSYAAFAASPYASHLVPVVEKRWANCEQPLMVLPFALHPAEQARFCQSSPLRAFAQPSRERHRQECFDGDARTHTKPVDPTERPMQQLEGVSNPATPLPAMVEGVEEDFTATAEPIDYWLGAIADLDEDGEIASEESREW